jgi:hypothetical protein
LNPVALWPVESAEERDKILERRDCCIVRGCEKKSAARTSVFYFRVVVAYADRRLLGALAAHLLASDTKENSSNRSTNCKFDSLDSGPVDRRVICSDEFETDGGSGRTSIRGDSDARSSLGICGLG